MTAFKDLTGLTFGRLLVLHFSGRNERGVAIFLCECSCGKHKEIAGIKLSSGHTKSCGCLQKETVSKTFSKNLEGQSFGRLIVLTRIIKEKKTYYTCICSCGKTKDISAGNLINGHTTSCGCYNRERSYESKKKNLVGLTFGRIKVLEFIKLNSRHESIYLCECICGTQKEIRGSHLSSGLTVSCGCLKESFIASELKKYFKINYGAILEYNKCVNPNTGYFLPYDIYIPEYELYIEVQGSQHYQEHSGYFKGTLKEIKQRDQIKKRYAKQNGIFIEIDIRKQYSIQEWIEYIENFMININHQEMFAYDNQ